MFAMTSFGAGVDELVNKGRGPYVFKIFGQIYHWIGSLCLEHGHHLRFLLLYVYDTKDEVNNRMHHFCGPNACTLNPDIVKGLIHVLDEHNGLVRPFRTTRDRSQIGEIPGFKIRLYNMGGVRGYELPTYEALGGIVFESGPRSRTNFDVIIKFRGRPPQRINKLHQSYMSLQFPLLFIFSQPGFYPDITLKPRDVRGRGKIVKMNAYYKYQLHLWVKEFGLIFESRRLFQQYVVVVFCAIEQNRLDFMRMHQNYFRSDYLSRLYDAVSRGDRDGIAAGSKVMLPSTFTEGPRVFEKKVKDFFRFLKEVKTFGYVSAVLYTIEFQKTGLPNCHTLLWVDSKNELKDSPQINYYIFANIPDLVQDPIGYKLVTELIMHGPCNTANLGASNGHTYYRRRDTGVHVVKGESKLDNDDVLPYNRALCLAFEAYINLEYFGWSMLIKYLFKYISKGPDRILAKISTFEASTSATGGSTQIDEIQNYIDGPPKLWAKHWQSMRDDIPSKISKATGIPNYHVNTSELQGYILYELETILSGFGKSVTDFGFDTPLQHLLKDLQNKLLMEEKNYKRELLVQDAAQSVPKLNDD
ncbi:DNA helicase [Tanacetum coccineum]